MCLIKKKMLFAIMLVFLFGLCSWSGNTIVKYPENIGSFYGLCESVRDEFLAVYPYENPQQYTKPKKISWLKLYTDDNTEFYTPDGIRIRKEDLKAGEQAEFFYDTDSELIINEFDTVTLPCFKICLTGKFFLLGPAKLTVKSGENTCTALSGTASWTNSQGGGYYSGFEADAFSHPVDRENNMLQNDGSDSFVITFEIEPQHFTVRAWSGSLISTEERVDDADIIAGELNIETEGYTVTLPSNPDGWVIQIYAKWKHGNVSDEIYWEGGGEYSFFFSG